MNHVLDDKIVAESAPLTSSSPPPPSVTPTTTTTSASPTEGRSYVFGALRGASSVDTVANFTDWSSPITPTMNGQPPGESPLLPIAPLARLPGSRVLLSFCHTRTARTLSC
ncbi:uncharacterized protein LOC119598412 [Penaeus monodon]|uniref:uncharacterized protein LOC119598412 n=1 Tax=Penaeus monodon TaxID=6687 RepID=UPI0018A7120B|nr:uncharacterized protein LOC119598412 [Penaeus monodon]